VKLSILLPTHRHSLLACARIAQACSWAGPDIEVIVRDNSGNARKREMIANFQRDNCRIIFVEPCGPTENYSETLRLATGDFIFNLADDDVSFDHAISDLPGVIAQIGTDRSFVGITGIYAVETSKGTSLVSYQNIDSDDAAERLSAWLSYPGPNVLFYSVLRRELVKCVFEFMDAMPFSFSFHDQILCMLYSLSGKFFRLQRLMYLYDMGIWEVAESAQKRDLDYYKDAGLDPAINKLHWILCGFEGASLIMNSDLLASIAPAQRQPIADRWFSTMFLRFKEDNRTAFDSPLTEAADRLCEKLQSSTGQLTFESVLAEIRGFIALSSQTGAQDYFDFWCAVIDKRQLPPRRPGAPKPTAVNES
jgi:Glycosyl transferase family 2